MNVTDYLKLTKELMDEFRIPVRDTFSFEAAATDDRGRMTIEWVETQGPTEMKSKAYPVPGRKSMAYESACILVPTRFKGRGRDDIVVHECVHFLQHNTREEDREYIQFDGRNYPQYLAQRVEVEAHLIQLVHLARHDSEHWKVRMDESRKSAVFDVLDKIRQGDQPVSALPILVMCKHWELL